MSEGARVVIVSGSSGGNGSAIVAACREVGWSVVGVDLVPSEEVSASLVGSVTDPRIWIEAIDVAKSFGSSLSLVNNAGVSRPLPEAAKDRAEYWLETLSVNLYAPFGFVEALADECRQGTQCNSVVNICSLGAHLGFPENPAYQASKGGLLAMTRAFAIDLAPLGIRVNSVSPGYIQTNMTKASSQDPALYAERQKRTILGRWGSPMEVANVVRFLLSDEASYVTGADWSVDGGWMSRGL